MFLTCVVFRKIKEDQEIEKKKKKSSSSGSSSGGSSSLGCVSLSSLPHGELLKTWTLRKTQEACGLQSFQVRKSSR